MPSRSHVRGGSPEEVTALESLLGTLTRWEDESNLDRYAITYREMCSKAGPPLMKQDS